MSFELRRTSEKYSFDGGRGFTLIILNLEEIHIANSYKKCMADYDRDFTGASTLWINHLMAYSVRIRVAEITPEELFNCTSEFLMTLKRLEKKL